MKRIQKLDDKLVAQIAAGEVIESPAAIVKELVENSLDAGATEIEILILGDSFTEIQVRDNGSGIHADDLVLAVESFATSKISSLAELIEAKTMGFRGEALGSIAAVSRLTVESRADGATLGHAVHADESGKHTEVSAIPKGTRVVVRDLFYNVPVRRDYFLNAQKIHRQIAETITGITAANPAVAFYYQLGEDAPVRLSQRSALIDRLSDIWGPQIAGDILPIYHEGDGFTLEGYISKFYFYRNFASDMRLWVNQRPVFYKPLTMLLRHAYGELMPKGRFPFAALYLTLDTREVDVNVHPQKREIRFKRESALQNFLRTAFSRAIAASGGIRTENMVRQPQKLTQPPGKVSEHPTIAAAEPQALFRPPLGAVDHGIVQPMIPENLVLHTRIFNTFILATNDEGVYLIDQHTAHERINYEKFLDLLSKKKDVQQHLAIPVAVEASVFDRDRLRGAIPALERIGFAFEDLGPAGFSLTATPGYILSGEENAALAVALKAHEAGNSAGAAELFDQLAKDLSCRHAIRKGETASLHDFRELLDQLRTCENPMRCPHGRPTLVKIDEKEVFAYFKRQV